MNQSFCTLFSKSFASQKFKAIHPLDVKRVWFLLFDHVHLLKCMKNNWITQKCTKLTIDGVTYGFSYDVRAVYNSEKVNFLKTTPLIHMLQFTLQSCNFKMYITSFVFSTRRLLVLIVWWGNMRQQNLLNKSSNDWKFRMSLPRVKMAEWTTQTGQYKVPSLQTWLGSMKYSQKQNLVSLKFTWDWIDKIIINYFVYLLPWGIWIIWIK